MFGGEAFGSQALGATGDDNAPGKLPQGGMSIDDLCTDPPVAGVTLDEACDC